MTQLQCKNVTLGYEGHAVRAGLSFTVNAGDYLCITGENGSGKSTLMKTVLGLIKPLEGEITYGDGMAPGAIGYLPQQTAVQKDFPATVREVVLSGCQARRKWNLFYSRADRELAAANIRRMGIEQLTGRCYRELSGGQQQRVLLARALCAARRVLLLDEPVAGLDPVVTREMYSLIYDLNRADGITVIMISHDIDAALRYATHILHIGEETFFGTKEDYLRSAQAAKFNTSKGGESDV